MAQVCPTCSTKVIPGSLFCETCGASLTQVNVARKLRQSSFDTIKDATEGILAPGERLKGRHVYIIEEAIARSGFGATFRALDVKEEKQILVKQMMEQAGYDQFRDQLMKSFKREAKFLKRIKHPAFPRGFESFERNKAFYLVMEFINGKELSKAVEEYRKTQGKVEDGLLVYLGIEIADALEIIHLQGYIYRDLKPQNVMLDGISSRVKLIDFGTLYQTSDSDPLIFESEGYTPPEFKDAKNKFTAAGDVYSLGALLYEVATGDTPKLGDASGLNDGTRDKRLVDIIQKCLDPDPLKRFQRARHLRDELTKLTRKGFWLFGNRNAIAPIELSVLPKTLYPPSCTFCDYCGHADANSHAGYCKNCRIPMKVGRLQIVAEKDEKSKKEFFLYADETIIGSSSQAHFSVTDPKDPDAVSPKHLRVFRRKTGLWLESLERDKDTVINKRRILGPVELLPEDNIKLAGLTLKFSLKDAC